MILLRTKCRNPTKTAEEQKQLLMEELSHGVKNTFAMVQAVAFKTLKDIDVAVSDAPGRGPPR